MSTTLKWIRNIVIVLVAIVLVLYLLIRVFVGAVNTPISGKEFDSSAVGNRIQVPAGFSIGIYAEKVENARLLRFTQQGDLLVANTNLNQIVLLDRDSNADGKSEGMRVLMTDLNGPNGMDFHEDWLYIAETDAIGRVKFDHDLGQIVGEYQRIVTGLPGGGNHWRKTLRFGPDNLMYVTMGSSCNVCEEEDKRRATMMRYNPDGSGEMIFAEGLRNSAGFDWSPRDGHIYATDNGRDMLGDDFPPCEFNRVEEGKHYGWPYANGQGISDPDFGAGNESIVASSVNPVFDFQPHNAPLGMEFVRGKSLPAEYHDAAIAALHGSWNRSEKDGYKVVSLHFDEQGQVSERDFIWGLLEDGDVIGRPADVTEGPDGAIYVSDDFANVVYRVAYGEEQAEIANVSAEPVVVGFNAKETLASIDAIQKAELIAEGGALYDRFQCIACHADDGRGLKLLENLGQKYNIEGIAKYLARPNPPMPIFPLSEDNRQALGVYLIDRYPGNEP